MRSLMVICLTGLLVVGLIGTVMGAEAPLSSDSETCIDCHSSIHPGIVADWKHSRHAAITPDAALQVKGLSRKISAEKIPESLLGSSVGCAECHTLRGSAHADTFEHNGYNIHVVVSPDDCATCHPTERKEYAENIMSAAHNNLAGNKLYNDLERTILGDTKLTGSKVAFSKPDADTKAEACYYCHGTRLAVSGTETRYTDAGELEFPIITGWPNQGVGRINLDGSKGACSSCHARHQFSIATARKPYTCKECHAGPDVPAYKIYATSKHGNLFSSKQKTWQFDPVPWTLGKDFTAPTCAACHMSLVVDEEGQQISRRTHRINDRLGWRIFGLIYAHPQPKSPDTTIIRNKVDLPLPTNLDGTPAETYLIGKDEIKNRRAEMQRTCRACHSTSWTRSHFARLDNTITTTNGHVKTATQLMQTIWKKGYAQDTAYGGSLFDEYIERRWCDTWLLHANSTRFVSAMAGGGDYGVFENGRYHLSKTIMTIQDWLQMHQHIK